MSALKFYLVTDTHYFKNSLGASGPEYEQQMRYEMKAHAETESINKAVFRFLEETKEADTILFAGDLSFNGERECHNEFIEMLRKLRDSGKKIYVVTADHDFQPHPFAFNENGRYEPEPINRDELFDMYSEFGFGDAIAADRQHLSYVAQLTDKIRLLALNNDGSSTGKREFDPEHMAWIKEQTDKAEEDGQLMFAMNHFPLLGGQPIFSVIATAVQENATAAINQLADGGVHLCFTGHMHNQSINMITTEKGNKFYDVCTGSVVQSPAYMRLITIEDDLNTVDIKSIPIPEYDWVTDGRTGAKYLDDMFEGALLNLLNDLKDNPKGLMQKLHMGDNAAVEKLIAFFGKKLDTLTLGKAASLLFVKHDPCINATPLKGFIVKMVHSIFIGNQPYVEGTPEGDAVLGALKRLSPIFKKLNVKTRDGQPVDLYDCLKNCIGNYGIDDYNATITLK